MASSGPLAENVGQRARIESEPNHQEISRAHPVFTFSLIGSILGFSILFFAFSVLATLALFSDSVPPGLAVDEIWFIFLSLVFLLGALRYIFLPVRVAQFYDGYMACRGRGLKRRIPYSDIEQVSLQKLPLAVVFPMWSRRTQVFLRIKGEKEPIVVAANPKSGRLRGDLYSWLIERTGR